MTDPVENDAPECNCDSMGGRFGAHRPECPWQIAFEAQLAAEDDAGRIIRASDGQDITEAVQILYDIAHSSMDWGSGFLDNEEMESVIRLAVLMGWQVPDLPDNSPAMVSTARKFPEHYEVTFRHIPKTQYSEAYDRPHIRVIPPDKNTTHQGES